MVQYTGSLQTMIYLLLVIAILPNQLVLADIERKSTGDTQSAAKPNIIPGNKPLHISPKDYVEFEDNSNLATEQPEPRNSELQKLLDHEQESHMHLKGEIMLNDDATIEHPSLDDIDGVEVDITIDFE